MDRLDALRAFVVTVERGSLSAAARALGMSPASITRALGSLERRLGTTLLRRTTRSLALTDAGDRYLVVARRVLADLDAAERAAVAGTTEPRGTLKVTAPLAFGTLHVRPIAEAYLAAHPAVEVDLLLLDRVVHLVDEGIDVAVRIAHLADSALVATAVGSVRRMVVASPDYVARHGAPKTPGELARHRCIDCTAITPTESWSFGARRAGERAKQVRIRPVLKVNVADAAVRAAADGAGITCAVSYQVFDQLAEGTLVRLLAAFEPPPVPVHLVYPAASARTAKVRAFVELAAARLRALLSERRRAR